MRSWKTIVLILTQATSQYFVRASSRSHFIVNCNSIYYFAILDLLNLY